MKMMRLNTTGNALLGALAAVTVMGTISAGMVASYDGFLRQSRLAYVRAAMTSLDNRIRYLAMQPGAYTCGAGDPLAGVDSCQINYPFFYSVLHQNLPGACPAATPCGFVLDPDPDQPDPAQKKPFQVKVIDGKRTGVFLYLLRYEGKDFQLRPGGWNVDPADPDHKQLGMIIPREVLQAEDFDCADANSGLTPVFQGFDTAGKPLCRGFDQCPKGQYVSHVDFKTRKVTCVPLGQGNTAIDCARLDQQKISHVNWQDGNLDRSNGACSELPIPAMNGNYASTAVTPTTPVTPTPQPPAPTSGTWQMILMSGGPNLPLNCPARFSDGLPCSPVGAKCSAIRGDLISTGISWAHYLCQ